MKYFILLFTALIYLSTQQTSFSQISWLYSELNSGVTTSLNSVCNYGFTFPVQVWICGDNGVVLRTTSSGPNWVITNVSIPLSIQLNSISCKAPDTVLTAGNIGSNTFVYRTTNSGTNWVQVFTQTNGKINSVWMKNNLTGFMSGNPVGGRWSLWKTTNGGVNWDSAGLYLPQNGSETGFRNSMAIINNSILIGTNNTRIYRSANFGLNWSVMVTPEQNSTAVWNYWDTLSYTYTLAGCKNPNSTTNYGANWVVNTCPDTNAIVGFCPAYYGVSMNAPMAKYLARNNDKIYFTNFGNNFLMEYTAPAGNYNHMGYDIMLMYAMTTFAVRSNGGITRISLFRGGGIRTISDEIPGSYSLQQNYPNPFNPVTTIRFAVIHNNNYKLSNNVKLQIFDAAGRLVDTPFDQDLPAGVYEYTYDASKLASGVYFYRLITNEYSEIKKMILVK